MTRFSSRSETSLDELMERAALAALDDAAIDPRQIDSIHIGNMAAEAFSQQSGLGNVLAGRLGIREATTERVENTSASGASAFRNAVLAIQSGAVERALVIGGEKMSSASTERSTEIIRRITHRQEYDQGVTLPAFAGLAAAEYLDRYDVSRKRLAEVPVRSHENAIKNPYAQFQKRLSVEDVIESALIAEPLRLYDCCPTSDGAAAVVLTREAPSSRAVRVGGVASASGTHAVAEREDVLTIPSVETATQRVFSRTNTTREDIDVVCLHDAFSILEWVELEAMGFYPQGTAWKSSGRNGTSHTGGFRINPGGGLKARGHPIGATGVSQLVELVWQLRGQAPRDRAVEEAARGIALNMAGFGNSAVCTLLERVR